MIPVDPDVRQRFGAWRIDTLLEKHELYLSWDLLLATPDEVSLLMVAGQSLLIPFSPQERDQHAVVRAALDPVAEIATVFLARLPAQQDGYDPWDEGVLLIGRRVPGSSLYATIVWHDWYASTRGILTDGTDRLFPSS